MPESSNLRFTENGVEQTFESKFVYADIFQSGGYWTWGKNESGNNYVFGTNDTPGVPAVKSTPVTTFAGGTDWKSVASNITCGYGIKQNGTMWSWGRDATSVGYNFGGVIEPFANAGSVLFDGDDYLSIASDDTLNLGTGDFTIECWVKSLSSVGASTYAHIGGKGDGVIPWTYNISFYQNKFTFGAQDDGNSGIIMYQSSSDVANNTWYHLAVTRSSGTLKMYINGILEHTSTNINTDFTNTEPFTIGDRKPNDPYLQYPFDGYISNFRLVKGNALYTSNFTVPNAPLPAVTGTELLICQGSFADFSNNQHSVSGGGPPTASGSAIAAANLNITIPIEIPGGDWKKISAAERHAYAIKRDGTLWQWGYSILANNVAPTYTVNGSQFKVAYTATTVFSGGSDWKLINAGSIHCTAIKSDGSLWVWGHNRTGQLGTNDRVDRWTPVTTFAGGNDWKLAVATKNIYHQRESFYWNYTDSGDYTVLGGFAPESSSFAVKNDGSLWSWGSNYYGELGHGDNGYETGYVHSITPQLVSNNADWYTVGGTRSAIGSGNLFNWGEKFDLGIGAERAYLPVISQGWSNRQNYVSSPITTFAGGNNWYMCSHTRRSSYVSNQYQNQNKWNSSAAIKDDGTLWEWGDQVWYSNRLSIPVNTIPNTYWKQVECGYIWSDGWSAIDSNGKLWTNGTEIAGALGNNLRSGSAQTPVTTFAGGNNWKQVSKGTGNCAAIKLDGTLWTWGGGSTNYSTLGINNFGDFNYRKTPVTTFAGGTDWKQVACGDQVMGAIKTDGTLWMWGRNNQGQLGINSDNYTSNLYEYNSTKYTPVTTFAGGTNWDYITFGYDHVLATKNDGTLWTWGNNGFGQLTNSNLSSTFSRPVQINSPGMTWKTSEDQKRVYSDRLPQTLGGEVVVKRDGTLWAWGKGNSQWFKNINNSPPTQLPTDTKRFKGVASSENGSAAIRDNGELYTWGLNNNYGISGTNSSTDSVTPTQVHNGGSWKQVSVSNYHMAAIKTDGTLWTWGYGGGLGINKLDLTTHTYTPVTTFAGGNDWKQVTCNKYATFALKNNGQLWSWGRNNFLMYQNESTPVTLFSGSDQWRVLSTGHNSNHMHAIAKDGTLWGWGFGVLGNDDSTALSMTPLTTFAGGNNWKSVCTGHDFTVAIKTDGTLWTWGVNSVGQLGVLYSTYQRRYTPVTTFGGGNNWENCYCGVGNDSYVWATKTDGTLWTWGKNNKRQSGNYLSYGSAYLTTPIQTEYSDSNWCSPQHIPPAISASFKSSSAIRDDGTLWAWGSNASGELGINLSHSSVERLTPTQVAYGENNWKKVSSGLHATGAISKQGQMFFWGRNGVSSDTNSYSGIPYVLPVNSNSLFANTPIEVFGGGNTWKDVKLGGICNIATKSDGSLWTWGYSGLGNLTNNSSLTPVTTFRGGYNWKNFDISLNHSAAIEEIDL